MIKKALSFAAAVVLTLSGPIAAEAASTKRINLKNVGSVVVPATWQLPKAAESCKKFSVKLTLTKSTFQLGGQVWISMTHKKTGETLFDGESIYDNVYRKTPYTQTTTFTLCNYIQEDEYGSTAAVKKGLYNGEIGTFAGFGPGDSKHLNNPKFTITIN